jgi:TldD protein
MHGIDPAFLALPLAAVADAALSRATQLGAGYASLHVMRTRRLHRQVRDRRLEAAEDSDEAGLGVQVIHEGARGFAATFELTPRAAAQATEAAIASARVARAIGSAPVDWAAEPVYANGRWTSAYEQSPFDVAEVDRVAPLVDWCDRLLRSPAVAHVYAKVRATQEDKFFADLSGTCTTQERLRLYPQVLAVSVEGPAGRTDTMRTVGPPTARGWEYVQGVGWDWDAELAELPALLDEKLRAPMVAPGNYDLVIEPSNLWLTIHESVGHATELDRVLGYEAAYAGTSFATRDKLGSYAYGSPAMQVTADRTTAHGLATIGFDDEGVAAQEWDLIRDGVLVGYQLDRHTAPLSGCARSNGCAYAESWRHVPLQRMPNVSLQPRAGGASTADLIAGISRGLYIVGDKSWSIDMQRHNFQFTGQRFHRIEHGRLVGQVRDAAYQSTTEQFWRSLDAVGNERTYQLFGADLCGKGQPVQASAAGHGSPSALFRGVRIVNTLQEAGR